MEIFWFGFVFVLGTIIGSFLNVVIYRLHTSKSLQGRSHCMSCGKTLSWIELIPLLSYVVQRGHCKGCDAHVPVRYFVVELLTGLLFVLALLSAFPNFLLFAFYAVLISILVVIVIYDIRHTIIPNELTAMVGMLALLLLGFEFWQTKDFIQVLARLGAGLVAGKFFWGLWFVSKGRWIGLGDAKVALPLGIIVGLGGVFSMVVLSFWIGAIISVTLLLIERLLKRGKTRLHFLSEPLTIKSEVPFAPFLVAGFLLVQLFHADIFTLTYALFFNW